MVLVDRMCDSGVIDTTQGDKIMHIQAKVVTLRESVDSQVVSRLEGRVAELEGQFKGLRCADASWVAELKSVRGNSGP